MYRISELARQFGLSRSTLLYYDQVGLLTPSGRSESGYRQYSQKDRDRLENICTFRRAGVGVADILNMLSKEGEPDDNVSVLRKRLQEIGEEIRALQAQQRLLANILKVQALGELPAAVDKETWVEMLRIAGMDEAAMLRWYAAFEQRNPQEHHVFLLGLGIPEEEALYIRKRSAEPG